MPSLRPPRRFVVLSVVAAVACTGDPVARCGCDPLVPAGMLYGRVTSASGAR
jgi:hypothetical protein